MQVTRIECSLGFTVNTGDFQSVKALISMTAELDRNEDPDAAYAELRGKVLSNAVAMGADGHPDRVRGLLTNGSAPAPKTAPATLDSTAGETVAKKRGRPATKTEPKTELLGETTLGGLDKEDLLDASDGEDLLGGEPEPEITADMIKEKMREILKNPNKGKPVMVELLRKVGATDMPSVPVAKYQQLYAAANAELAK